MSKCRVFSCVVGRGYLLWTVCFLGRTLLAFALLHSVLQGQICLLLQVTLCLSPPLPIIAIDSTISSAVTLSLGPSGMNMWAHLISTRDTGPRVCSPYQQHQRHLGSHWKCQFLGPTSNLNQRVWGWGRVGNLRFNKPVRSFWCTLKSEKHWCRK